MLSKIFSVVKNVLSKKQVQDRAGLLEDALYGHGAKPDIEAVMAVANLTTALCNNKCSAAVDAGMFVFFKVELENEKFQIFHKRLTVRERGLLNRQPSLLNEPQTLLEKLDDPLPLDHDRALELRQLSLAKDK